MDVAKKGDRALVVGLPLSPNTNGTVVLVMSDPYVDRLGTPAGTLPAELINTVDRPGWNGAACSVIPTRCLVPLSGDPDAQTWTTEQGRKVDA